MQKIVAVRYYEGVLEDSDVEYVNNLIRAGWSIKMISTFETEHLYKGYRRGDGNHTFFVMERAAGRQ